uniref:Tetraspanin n=1 Tax=Octactis speculum TaxID=3111310 RepID=A0A7S2CA02_9STRA
MNQCIKNIFLITNSMMCFIAISLVGIGAYTIGMLEFGSNDLESLGIAVVFVGLAVMVIIIWGCVGTAKQENREGSCQGRPVLCFYLVCLLVVTGLQFYATIFLKNLSENLVIVEGELKSGKTNVSYIATEDYIAPKFNDYYFDTWENKQEEYPHFWGYIDDNCPDEMKSNKCNGDKYTRGCPNQDLCDDDSEAHCPYGMCRKKTVAFLNSWASPLGDYGIVITIFALVMSILSCLLICYNPHYSDSDASQIKHGHRSTRRLRVN